jgi:beta-lactamase class C
MRFVMALLLCLLGAVSTHAATRPTDDEVKRIVTQEVEHLLRGAGAAVAVRIDGRTLFFNFGFADRASRRPVTSGSVFNLASVGKAFDATLLALAVRQGEVSFDDTVGACIEELRQGGDIRDVTLGELITFTSGFRLPQDHPPFPPAHFTLTSFLEALKAWKREPDHRPGQYLYSHAGIMLLHLALERRFGVPYAALLEQKLLRRLALSSTTLPVRGAQSAGKFAPSLRGRVVQGYSENGRPLGKPGDVQGHYYWPGSEQLFSSARDVATFLAAHLGEQIDDPLLRDAIEITHREVAPVRQNVTQAHAWEAHHGPMTILDKNGGLSNSTTYIGMIPAKRLGVVILINRGWLDGREIGHPILQRLASEEMTHRAPTRAAASGE